MGRADRLKKGPAPVKGPASLTGRLQGQRQLARREGAPEVWNVNGVWNGSQ
jgi:hypothetical protein